MPKYYGGFNSMILELNGIHLRGCRFLVAGRVSDDGSCFLTLDDVSLPEEVTSMVSIYPCYSQIKRRRCPRRKL